MGTTTTAAVALYWIPLGAGGNCVRFNGRVYEALAATRERRPRCALYHAALVIDVDGERYTVEIAPSPDGAQAARGVVGTGAVGSRHLGRLRLFRYEVRCWRGGAIPDLAYAVGGARLISTDPVVARRIVDLMPAVPRPVWGRDELHAGEMWNSNSMVAWLIATVGVATGSLRPPDHGRAPGWDAGLRVAVRGHRDDTVVQAAPRRTVAAVGVLRGARTGGPGSARQEWIALGPIVAERAHSSGGRGSPSGARTAPGRTRIASSRAPSVGGHTHGAGDPAPRHWSPDQRGAAQSDRLSWGLAAAVQAARQRRGGRRPPRRAPGARRAGPHCYRMRRDDDHESVFFASDGVHVRRASRPRRATTSSA